MSWNKEADPRNHNAWQVPKAEVVIHEETAAVEDLNIYPENLSLLPLLVQHGQINWSTQELVNFTDNWIRDHNFYAATSENWLDNFYAVLGGWTEGFYAALGEWYESFGFYAVSAGWTSGFYAISGGWLEDSGFYAVPLGWTEGFYSAFAGWLDGFYTTLGGWYLQDESI